MHRIDPCGDSRSGRSSNNFNALRFLAASLVILSHGIELPSGLTARDWAYRLTGHSFSWYAVNLFFVISGYLIFASWDAKPSFVAFARARCLRILPGLIVMLVLCVVILGLGFSNLPFLKFISSETTLNYFLGCLSVIFYQMQLPGVFESNPLAAVNGSLWTLRYEVFCYTGIATLGVLGVLANATLRRTVLALGILAATATTVWIETQALPLEGKIYICYQTARLGLCFLLGGAYRECASLVPLRIEVAAALFVVMLLVAGTPGFTPVACLAIGYLTFWCAFAPNNAYCKVTRTAPDYSYGLYIYAFPVQQALIATIPSATSAQVIILGFAITLAFAALSWHWIEKPALALKQAAIFSRRSSSAGLAPWRSRATRSEQVLEGAELARKLAEKSSSALSAFPFKIRWRRHSLSREHSKR
jgi:peptidoglycan/LPS O-acetylase OafA/YrhL